jgi:hypothetical protein
MVNWFQRHLNWTAVIILVAGVIFTFIFSLISTAFYRFSTWNEISRPEIYRHVVILLCSILIFIGFGWVLSLKKRSLFFLLFFIPLVATWVFSMLQLFYEVLMMAVIPIALAITGFLLLLVIKNRSAKESNRDVLPNRIRTLFSHEWYSHQSARCKVLLNTVAILLLLIVLFTDYSYQSMENVYSTYIWEPGNEKTVCTFEYSLSYEEPWLFHDWLDYLENIRLDRYLWFQWESSIAVHVMTKDTIPFFEDMNSMEKTEMVINDTLTYIRYRTTTILDLEIGYFPVKGYSAIRATATVPEVAGENGEYGTVDAVWFERGSDIWAISIFYPEKTKHQPSKPFEHLLETFEIID